MLPPKANLRLPRRKRRKLKRKVKIVDKYWRLKSTDAIMMVKCKPGDHYFSEKHYKVVLKLATKHKRKIKTEVAAAVFYTNPDLPAVKLTKVTFL